MTHQIKSYSEKMRSAIPILPFPERPYRPRQPPQSGFWSFSVCLRAPMIISTLPLILGPFLLFVWIGLVANNDINRLRDCFTSLAIFQSAERHADKQFTFFSHEN